VSEERAYAWIKSQRCELDFWAVFYLHWCSVAAILAWSRSHARPREHLVDSMIDERIVDERLGRGVYAHM
jgi:hypothetical protein